MSAVLLLAGLGLLTAGLLSHQITRRPLVMFAAWLGTEPYTTPLFATLTQYIATAAPATSTSGRLAGLLFDVLTLNRLVVGAFLVVLAVEILRGRRSRPTFGVLDALMVLFSVLLLASVALLANNKDHALRTAGDAFIFPFLVAFIARVLVTDWKAFHTVLAGVSVLGFLLVVNGLVERFAAAELLHRLHGPFQNQALLGAVLVVLFFTLMTVLRDERFLNNVGRWVRAAYEVALHLTPAVLFFSFSRGAWLAFLLAMGLLLIGARWLLPMKRIVGVAAVSAVAIGLWSIFLAGRQKPLGPLEFETAPLVQEFLDTRVANVRTLYYRIRAWQQLLPTVGERPLWGLGLGNSVDYLREHPAPLHVNRARNAHSAYLSILFETGLSGFLSFLAIQAVIVRRGIALARAPDDEHLRWLGLILLALTLAYSVPGIPANTFLRATVGNVLYYALVGCVLTLGAQGQLGRLADGDRPQRTAT